VRDPWAVGPRKPIHRPARSDPRTKGGCPTASSVKWIQLVLVHRCPAGFAYPVMVVKRTFAAKKIGRDTAVCSIQASTCQLTSPPASKWLRLVDSPKPTTRNVLVPPDATQPGDRLRRSETCAFAARLNRLGKSTSKMPGIRPGLPRNAKAAELIGCARKDERNPSRKLRRAW